MRRLVGAAATLLLIAVAGCGADGDGSGGSGPGGGVRAVDGPVGMGELAEVCSGDVALTGADRYVGAAPHPVVVFQAASGNDPDSPGLGVRILESPPPGLEDAFRVSSQRAQIVACAERIDTTPTDITCRYDLGDDAPFFRATYRVAVREAATGRVVGTPEIEAAAGCPSSATVNLAGPEIYSTPEEQQYYRALRPFALWDGQGEPGPANSPAASAAARGAAVTRGPATMAPPADADPTTAAALDGYLAFRATWAEVQQTPGANGYQEFSAVVDPDFAADLANIHEQILLRRDRVVTGPVSLAPAVRAGAGPDEVIVDDCVDETRRMYVDRAGSKTGETGQRYPDAVTMRLLGGRWLAAGFAEPLPDGCAAAGG